LFGDSAPEAVLRRCLDSWRAGGDSAWHVDLDGGEVRLKMALERLDGMDHHDWIYELGVEYGSREKVVESVVGLALMNADLLEDAQNLAKWIRAEGRLGE
jgi:hypothetical protein